MENKEYQKIIKEIAEAKSENEFYEDEIKSLQYEEEIMSYQSSIRENEEFIESKYAELIRAGYKRENIDADIELEIQ